MPTPQQKRLLLRPGTSTPTIPAPTNTVAPVISGTQSTGSTLTATNGTWTGSPAFTYQWKRAGVNISSATNNTYVLVTADEGQDITCVVTGTNAGGSASASSNALNTLNQSLISYWKSNESSAGSSPVTRADSIAASGNDLTDTNNVASGAGIISNGAVFVSASSKKLSHASNASLQTGDIDFSVAFWFNATTYAIGMVLLGKTSDLGSVTNTEWVVYANSNTTIRFRVSNGSAVKDTDSGAIIGAGSWFFIVAWHDSVNNTVNLQINNGTPISQAYSLGLLANAMAFNVGTDTVGGRFFNGIEDEIGFWKRVLTSNERTALYNSGAGKTLPVT